MKYLHKNLSMYQNIYKSTTRTPHHHLPSSIVEDSAQFKNSSMGRVSNIKRDGRLSCFSRTDSLNGEFVAKQEAFHVSFSCCSRTTVSICETRSPSKAPEDRSPDRPIRTLLSGLTSRIVQSDRSGRTDKSTNQSSSTDLISVSTNQSSSTDLLSVLTNQSSSTDLLSISTNQSSSTDLLSVSTNQSSSTDLLSVSSNQIFPTDLLSVLSN